MLQTSSPSIAVNFTIDMLKIQTKWKLMSSMEQISTWYTSCAKWLIMTWPPTWHILRNWISTNCLDWSFIFFYHIILLWLWLYGNWIYNNLCNQYLSPLMLWVRILIRTRCTTLCDKVCQWLATGRWFSLGPPVSSINKTDRHDKTKISLKVALNTIKQEKNISIT